MNTIVPKPSKEQVSLYLNKWDNLENYSLQEDSLDKLFFELCPNNTSLPDILIKCSCLNDFYTEKRKEDLDEIIKEERLKPEETEHYMLVALKDGYFKTTGTDFDHILPPISRF